MKESPNTGMHEKKPVLSLVNVSKNFGGVVAAKEISFDLYGGEIFGLIGPNGAGKTTLINMITGVNTLDSGTIKLGDRNISRISIHSRAKLGVIRTFQHPRLLGRCDIRTNIFMGRDLANRRRIPQARNDQERLDLLLEAGGLARVRLSDSVEKLSYGQQKLLEVIRSLLCYPDVLLLDEPAAGLNSQEMEYVVNLINIAVEENIGVLLIEHAMDLVMGICDRLTVLNFGHQIATGTPAEIQSNPDVINAYLGGGSDA